MSMFESELRACLGEILGLEPPVPDTEPLALEQADFVRAVRERRAPLVSGEEGRDAVALAGSVQVAIAQSRARASAGVTA